MDFSAAIEKIMPDVQDGSDEPFLIFRDGHGEWHCDYTQNQYSDEFDWVEKAKDTDPLALTYKGTDFSKSSYSFVYDEILSQRIAKEFNILKESGEFGSDSFSAWLHDFYEDDAQALVNFFSENVSSMSNIVTDYLTKTQEPFLTLMALCPYNMATDNSGWRYNENAAEDAIKSIELAVRERMNIKTFDEINVATRRAGNRINVNEYTPLLTTNLNGWQVMLAENPGKENPYLVECRRDPDLGIQNDIYFCGVTADYLEAMTEFADRLKNCVDVANSERKHIRGYHNIEYALLTSGDCLPDSHNDDFTGKLLVVRADALKPEYRSSENQLVQCTHGNGARPNAKGTSVFCKELHSGKSVCFGRHEIAGIADPEKLPQWAKIKLEIQQDSSIFEYGRYHFKPLRKFGKGEITKDGTYTDMVARNLSSDRDAGISKYDWKISDIGYSHESFYDRSGNSGCDIFRCIENGKLYVPGENELFIYNEPPQKTKAKKPSLTGRLDEAKSEAAARNKERKTAPKTKNKSDKEV